MLRFALRALFEYACECEIRSLLRLLIECECSNTHYSFITAAEFHVASDTRRLAPLEAVRGRASLAASVRF